MVQSSSDEDPYSLTHSGSSGYSGNHPANYPPDTGIVRSLYKFLEKYTQDTGIPVIAVNPRRRIYRIHVSSHGNKPLGNSPPSPPPVFRSSSKPERSICRAQVFRSLQQTQREVSTGHRYSVTGANSWVIPTGFRYFLVTAANPWVLPTECRYS
jgi:hypothetical protein